MTSGLYRAMRGSSLMLVPLRSPSLAAGRASRAGVGGATVRQPAAEASETSFETLADGLDAIAALAG